MTYLRRLALAAIVVSQLACAADATSGTGDTPKVVSSVTLSATTPTITVGNTLQLIATPREANGTAIPGKPATWTTSAPTIATVSNSGLVTGVSAGSATITATIDGKSAEAAVQVQPVGVASVTVAPLTFTVALGEKRVVAAVVKDAQGNTLADRLVNWSTDDPSVATVNATTGEVTGVSGGTAGITAASEGHTATANVIVSVPVATVEIVKSLDTLEAWDIHAMQAVTRDAQGRLLTGRLITWTVSNTNLATFENANAGLLTGLDRGTVTITATSEGKQATATRVVVIKYRSVAAGSMHACDLASGGIAWCWGLNGAEGRIGAVQLGNESMSSTPVKVPGNLRFKQLVSFGRHSCGLTNAGAAYCWGYNGWGALGANFGGSQSFTPMAVAGGHIFSALTAGSDHACGITAFNGVAYCWGNNDWRQLGTGTSATASAPVAVNSNNAFQAIAAGSAFSCGVTMAGAAYCWGANSIGQVGDGGPINYGNVFVATPQPVSGGRVFRAVAVGNQYACGLTTANQAYCWGSNNGKLGNGAGGNDSSTPVAVSGGFTFATLSVGNGHACAVTLTDEAYCWGSNAYGQLGNAIQNGSTTPVRAGGSLKLVEVAAAGIGTGSAGHTCAISADRLTAYCWGRNDVGQLGNGATAASGVVNPTPSIISGQKPL